MTSNGGGTGLGALVESARVNAVFAWALVGLVFGVVVWNALAGLYLWAGFAATVGVLALFVPLGHRTPRAMLPWEVLALAVVPLLVRTLTTWPALVDVSTYLSVAAVALIVAVELQVFTSVQMSPRFAVGFVVVATLAAAGAWAVVRFGLDARFGTELLGPAPPPGAQIDPREEHLMLEFVYSTLTGLLAGVVFEGYLRRRDRPDEALPTEVRA